MPEITTNNAILRSNSAVAGYFGPQSMTWRLYREPIVIIGGVRALLLQVAHPAVAEGVAHFSNFKKDALGRGFRTFSAMAMIYFGDKNQADAVAQRLWRVHSAIKGPLPERKSKYQATDPALLLWVLATLTETTIQVFEQVPLPGLPADWREQFYEESKVAATLLGIPAKAYPVDLPTFRQYFSEMLHSPLLGSTTTTGEVAQAILQHRFTPTALANLLAAGGLPEPLAQRLGIQVPHNYPVRFARWLKMVRVVYRLVPRWLRYSPAYYQALRRIAQAAGKREPLLGRWYDWLGRTTGIPLGLNAGRKPTGHV